MDHGRATHDAFLIQVYEIYYMIDLQVHMDTTVERCTFADIDMYVMYSKYVLVSV